MVSSQFVAFTCVAAQDATRSGIRFRHRRADADRITPRRTGVGRLLAGVGIATLSVAVLGCGGARSLVQPIDLARIPGAQELGRVEVERRHSAHVWGWQCDTSAHLDRVSEVREGTSPVVSMTEGIDIDTVWNSVLHTYEIRRRTEAIDATVWNSALRTYVLRRLTEYYPERGKPGLRGQDRTYSWRDWLRGTLERINATADEAGMSQKEKEATLRAWVVCHVSVAEAVRIRNLILASEEEGE